MMRLEGGRRLLEGAQSQTCVSCSPSIWERRQHLDMALLRPSRLEKGGTGPTHTLSSPWVFHRHRPGTMPVSMQENRNGEQSPQRTTATRRRARRRFSGCHSGHTISYRHPRHRHLGLKPICQRPSLQLRRYHIHVVTSCRRASGGPMRPGTSSIELALQVPCLVLCLCTHGLGTSEYPVVLIARTTTKAVRPFSKFRAICSV